MSDKYLLRRAEYALEDEQRALRDAFSSFYARECPPSRVRDSEPLGFDDKLWSRLVDMGAVGMAVPEANGGDGAGLVDLVLVAELHGCHLAPVPLVEAVTAARLLAAVEAPGLDQVLAGSRLVTFAVQSATTGRPQLLPSGAVADAVVALVGDDLVLTSLDPHLESVGNQAHAPLAWWTPGRGEVLASGPTAVVAYAQALREWRLLMAATQVGIADGALAVAAAFAKDRMAFGVPIATFQAVSHPLVNVAIDVTGARRMVWRAAWFEDHEPGVEPQLVPMAYVQACATAGRASSIGIHAQGGLGFTMESDMQLHFRRAKGWANVAGDPQAVLTEVADILYPATGTAG